MKTESFLYALSQAGQRDAGFEKANTRCGELARENASAAVGSMNRACAMVMVGQERDISIATRAAHCAAFELMTYGEISRELNLFEPDVSEQLIASGAAVQDRALEREAQFGRGELSPSQLFFDDLVDLSLLKSVPSPRVLLDLTEPVPEAPTA